MKSGRVIVSPALRPHSRTPQSAGSSYSALRYTFKPPTDPSRPAVFELDSDDAMEWKMELPSSFEGGDPHRLVARPVPSKEVECLLFWDEATQTYSLEPLEATITATAIRGEHRSSSSSSSSSGALKAPTGRKRSNPNESSSSSGSSTVDSPPVASAESPVTCDYEANDAALETEITKNAATDVNNGDGFGDMGDFDELVDQALEVVVDTRAEKNLGLQLEGGQLAGGEGDEWDILEKELEKATESTPVSRALGPVSLSTKLNDDSDSASTSSSE